MNNMAAGGPAAGSDAAGGDTASGDTAGGDTAGGQAGGGPVAGGDAAGGDTAGGHGDTAGALRRVLGQLASTAVLDDLAARLSGADLTTLLLEVFRRRAGRLSAADVLRRYDSDRFVAPAVTGFAGLRRAEDGMLAALPDGFDILTLAPVLPLGAHSAVAAVDPRNVIATIRGTEVAADPTNGLALEAAARRRAASGRAPRSDQVIRLAASQRVTRAQRFSGPVSFAHFQLLGLVTAGRDTGSQAFERGQLAEHLRFGITAVQALGARQATVELTCWDGPSARVADAVRGALAELPGAGLTDAPDRPGGRGYYCGLCFKIIADFGAGLLEVADGGFVDWTQRLLGNRKERLLISGYGLDRIAMSTGACS